MKFNIILGVNFVYSFKDKTLSNANLRYIGFTKGNRSGGEEKNILHDFALNKSLNSLIK